MYEKRPAKPVFDRTPPQNIDAERSVLGAMLLNPEAVGTAIEVLREEAGDVFYVEAHQHVYSAIVTLYRKNTPIDAVTLVEQLTRDSKLEEAGGVSYISELTGAVPTSANLGYYAQIVLETAILRKMITTCTQYVGEAYESPDDVPALLDRAESSIMAIAEKRQLTTFHKLGDLVPGGVERLEMLQKSGSGITGLPTSFVELDKLLSGLQPSDMIVLAARPSVGKTALALNIAAHVGVELNKGVLVFSLEMSKEQLTQRLLCLQGQIDTRKLREGFLAGREFQKVHAAADKLSKAPIYIDDTPSVSVLEIRSKARRLASTLGDGGLQLVIVDYLQLMRGASRAESRQVEIAEISRSIKGLARELSLPVLALSQLNREAEKDDSGAPKLSHLRESGAIEQDADVVLMLSRPPAHESEGNENLIRLDIAKQRNGPTGKVQLLFDRNVQRFRNLAQGMNAGGASPSSFDVNVYDEEYAESEEDVPF